MNSLLSKGVFLDRDGVINRKAPEGDYIRTWRELQFLPGVVEAVASLNDAGYLVFVATNQRGVATARIRMADLLEVHRSIQHEFARGGGIISQIYYCPHDTSAKCSCRKPQPGMLQQAAREHRLELKASWMIGDSVTDIEAGYAAGCRTVLLSPRSSSEVGSSMPTMVAEDLKSAVAQIRNLKDTGDGFVRTSQINFSRKLAL